MSLDQSPRAISSETLENLYNRCEEYPENQAVQPRIFLETAQKECARVAQQPQHIILHVRIRSAAINDWASQASVAATYPPP